MESAEGTLVSQVTVAQTCLASDQASITPAALRWKGALPQGRGERPWSGL